MATQFLLAVSTCVRGLIFAAPFLALFTFAPPAAWGQNPSSTSLRTLPLKPEPRKVWTEDDLARLLKPWDLYEIAQEKKSALAAAAPVAQKSPANSEEGALRAMDSRAFNRFLKRLAMDVATWQVRLKNIDFVPSEIEYQEQEEIGRRYDSSQDALERVRDDVTRLSQDQTLKLDLLLLIDLNALARSLDGLSVNLASPLTLQGTSAAHKFLGWAQEVLSIDEELAPRITEFQYHVLALAGAWDAAVEETQQPVEQAR